MRFLLSEKLSPVVRRSILATASNRHFTDSDHEAAKDMLTRSHDQKNAEKINKTYDAARKLINKKKKLSEDVPTNSISSGSIAKYDPLLKRGIQFRKAIEKRAKIKRDLLSFKNFTKRGSNV